MIEDRLEEVVDETVKWAEELSESWTGTTTGRILDSQKDRVQNAMSSGDTKLASVEVLQLAQTCDYAEKELND